MDKSAEKTPVKPGTQPAQKPGTPSSQSANQKPAPAGKSPAGGAKTAAPSGQAKADEVRDRHFNLSFSVKQLIVILYKAFQNKLCILSHLALFFSSVKLKNTHNILNGKMLLFGVR